MSVALGSAIVPGGGSTPAGVESELRFYAAAWTGFGLLLGLTALRIEERGTEFRVLCGVLFLGGIGRALAIADTGWPPMGLVVLMGVELVLPLLLLGWHARVLRGAADTSIS